MVSLKLGVLQMTMIQTASNEWRTRPADQRYTSLIELRDSVRASRARSTEKVVSSRKLGFEPANDEPFSPLQIIGPNGNPASPTHWSMNQLASLSGVVPADALRKLPTALAADCLNFGFQCHRDIEDVGVLLERGTDQQEPNRLKAATGPRYGRIWNDDIASAFVDRFGDGVTGEWRVPGEFGKAVTVTKANTTLYASDRDLFIFLADEQNRIEVPNRRNGKPGSLARGFYAWNSEVGSASVGAAFFMFDYVCQNRMIWGVEGFKEFRLRHTVSAPDRWLGEISPVLIEYANSAASPVEAAIKAAQAKKLDNVKEFMAKRFGVRNASQYMQAHEREESRPIETLWDCVTGVTAFAKTIEYQDSRVALEREAGELMALAA
jgi:hypothetical protein